MADAWGGAFGVAWGVSWGSGAVAPAPTPPSQYGGRKHRDALTRDLVESAYELLELRQRNQAERDRAREEVVVEPITEPQDTEQPKERSFMVRIPGAQPSRVTIPEGATISRADMLALLIALTELDD